jgi:nucleoside-diphosphate-sugar epimerase
MKLSVTGASGFVGTNFKTYFVNSEIYEIDQLIQKVEETNFKGITSILHLSALVHQMQGAPEKKYFEVNSDLAFDTAKKAKEEGVSHFLYMSTVKVYGEFTEEGQPWTEDTPCHPLDPYGKSKLEGEQRVKSLADSNFTVSVVRTPLVYGPGVRANMFNLMKMVNKYPFVPFGNIHNKRSLTFVGNLCQLLHTILDQKKSGVFLASDGKPVSTTDLVKEISKASGKKKNVLPIPGMAQKMVHSLKPGIHRRLFGNLEIDNTKTCEILNYQPEYSFDQGIREMVEGYKSEHRKK